MSVSAELAAHRFGLGARAGEIDAMAVDPVAHLLEQVANPDAIPTDDLKPSFEILAEHNAHRAMVMAFQKAKAKANSNVERPKRGVNPVVAAYRQETAARWRHYAATSTPFVERLAMFWSNHFTVSGRQNRLSGMVGAYEREAIRPHINGHFSDMLLAVAQHPAMLLYLNNAESTGPNSVAGKKRERGLNENFARELLELHTLGVGGGYQIKDIQALAKSLTGWSVIGPKDKFNADNQGKFQFRERAHEPGAHVFLGDRYQATHSPEIGEKMLMRMARHPSTALFIARKLAGYFVSDMPSDDLVKTIARAFYHGEGALMPTYEAMLRHPEAWATTGGTFKPPLDFLASALRSFDTNLRPQEIDKASVVLGQPMWHAASPQGYKTDQKTWVTSDSLKTRLDMAVELARRANFDGDPLRYAHELFGSRLADGTMLAIQRAADTPQAIAIMLMAPEFQRR